MKQHSQKCIAILLLCLLVFTPLLTACNGDPAPSPQTEGSTEPPVDPDAGRIKIVDEGEAVYTIVYPDNAPSVITRSMNLLIDEIKEKTGVRLESKSDFLPFNKERDHAAKEILIGSTAYEETKAVEETLMADQYAIRAVDNKIVIAAIEDSYIRAAVNYILSDLLEPNIKTNEATGKKTLFFQEYTLPSKGGKLSINGHYIDSYSIVYATDLPGYKTVAEQLKSLVSESTGFNISVYADTERAESECEILIGKTNRSTSQTLYTASNPKLLTFETVIKGGKLQILCGGAYSARECVSDMRFSFFGASDQSFKDGTLRKRDLATTTSALTEGADLRIMTSNVLAAQWGELSNGANAATTPPTEQRAEIYAAVLANYLPDAVGVQETGAVWNRTLPLYLERIKALYGVEYTWVHSEMGGKPNMTSILYRSDLYRLDASDCEDYSFWKESSFTYHLRVMAWVKLTSKTDASKSFVLLNTHWSWESPEQKELCLDEEIAKIKELRQAYNVPIFCTGDFNARQDSAEIISFQAGAGVTSAMETAKANGQLVNYIGGCGNVGSNRTSETYIDHIFGCGNYDVAKYETVLANRVVWLSDHAPQYTDIILK